MFNYGAIVSTFVQAPAGLLLDVAGPKFTALIGLLMLVPGSFIFAFSSVHFNGYLAGFVMMSAGGPWTFVSVMPSSSLFPEHRAMILMLLNGAYGGGAFVFFAFAALYNNYNITLQTLFIAYGIICAGLALLVIVMWPMKKYSDVVHAAPVSELTPLVNPVESAQWRRRVHDIVRDALTVGYLWHVLFTSFMVLTVNFYLSTSYQQLQAMSSDTDLVNKYNVAFGVLLPALGFIGGTPLGSVIDKWGIYVGALVLMACHCVASGLALVSILPLQMLRYVIFACYNPVVFGYWATFVIVKFGTMNYGTLFGIIALAAGCVNFAAGPLDNYTAQAGSYFWVYIGFLCVTPIFVWYPLGSLWHDYRYSKSRRYSDSEKQTDPVN